MSFGIKDLLLAYKARLKAPQGSVLREVVRAYGLSGLDVTLADIDYSPTTKMVVIKAGGPKKSEMLMRKTAVLKEVRTALRDIDAPVDII